MSLSCLYNLVVCSVFPGCLLLESDTSYETAINAVARNELNEAVQGFEAHLSGDSNHRSSRLWLGRLYAMARMEEKSLAQFDALEQRSDSDPGEVLIAKADALCWLGKPQRALSLLEAKSWSESQSIAAQSVRARALFQLKRAQEALTAFEKAAAEDASAAFWSGALYMAIKRPSYALSAYQRCLDIIEASSEPSVYRVMAYDRIARITLDRGDFQGSIEALESLLPLTKKKFWAWHSLGLSHLSLMNYAHARDAFQNALRQKPTDLKTLLRLGFIEETLANFEQALGFYRQAEVHHRNHPFVLERVGSTLFHLDRWDESKAVLDRAILSGHDSASIRFVLASMLKKNGELDKAAEYLEFGIQQDPLHVKSYYLLCQILFRTKNKEDRERARELREIYKYLQPLNDKIATCLNRLEASPSKVESRVELAEILRQIGRLDLAIDHLDRALELRPNTFGALKCRGEIYRETSQVRLAERDFGRAEEVLLNLIQDLEVKPTRTAPQERTLASYRDTLTRFRADRAAEGSR